MKRLALDGLPRFVRFLLTGGLNTAVTYGVYLLLLGPIGYRWAYVASFVFGVVQGLVGAGEQGIGGVAGGAPLRHANADGDVHHAVVNRVGCGQLLY